MLDHNFFNTVFVFPILNLLVALYKGFQSVGLPGAFGFAIIGLTVLVRLLFHPFFKQQMETTHKMQKIKPHLDKLSEKHKKDPKKLQQEQLKLYQEAGINPASGCLFMIIQIPVFLALYNTLSLFLNNGSSAKLIGQINKALYLPALHIQSIDPWFLGINLASTPAKGGHWAYYAVPVITALLQYLQVSVSTPMMSPKTEKKDGKKGEEKKDTASDFQSALNTQMKYVFPLMIGWFSYSLPIGLSLYWNIFSLFSIMQGKRLASQLKAVQPQESSSKDKK